MLFVTVRYFAFLFVVLALFYSLPGRYRKYLLLFASYFFYASWNWKFIPLLAGLTVVDYFAALWIVGTEGPRRHMALGLSLAANLGFLGIFKYYNFVAANLALLIGRPEHSFFLDIVLPLGISFHTFQSISYVVDVYRDKQTPIRSFTDYALFICFFPQLVAGPIVRASEFFRDFYHWKPPAAPEIQRGCFLLVFGMTKKLVLADSFAMVADRYFSGVASHPGLLPAWGGALSFACEIYFDFSGYSDMAIGAAQLLGFHFPTNFRQPFLAISVTDFWRRWHVTLSSWLRDYLYIPLGGGRRGLWIASRNTLITMALAGLWHGAKWGFVAWGVFNGLLLVAERAARINRIRDRPLRLGDIPATVVTFALFCIGVIFVRADTMKDAFIVIRACFSSTLGAWPVGVPLMVLLAASLGGALLEDRGWIHTRVQTASVWSLGAFLGLLLFLVEVLGEHQSRPFYYFQF
jgi:alginate O-acetyltransferase complex protein AlgI